MTHYTIIVRQLNTTGAEGIYDTFHTTNSQAGRDWLTKTMHSLHDGIQTVGLGKVPAIAQVFKNEGF